MSLDAIKVRVWDLPTRLFHWALVVCVICSVVSAKVGHSPLGALSVFALLSAQVGSGLFADDEISNTGLLVKFVTGATSRAQTAWHKTGGHWLILSLVALHVAAIVTYRVRHGLDLVRPMVVGDKEQPPLVPASADTPARSGLALLLVTPCGLGASCLVSLGG